ncbi:hypothetical protein NEILACOT_05195 [Neisseria lactamica ATCC 23970]|uniref:Uncharacterized protein n=1 Tax=Neisseria lactamica ATCC 23970 TaxID=546265 RepID=D0WCB4_NEILA|nr:hypothetical protein [Neisseria lactamica]EEZ74817.1 hypothetical protein NEILACOT_05195 [Neisseria lactamica ATCC 23970]KFJ35368.1 hypothetical protein DR91_916 [Neisseria lactamica ATCC 23970]VTQ48772.1 Uncharacterised protein [Neisseria lactamica]
MNSKTKLRVNKIIELKHHIENWETQTSEEIEKLLVDFEKQPRQEMSSYYTELFRDVQFAGVLVQIANKYAENSKINRCIVSALGMMMWRYKLPESEEIYRLMLANIQRKMFLYYSNKINCKFIILLFLLAIQFYIFSEYKNPSGFFTIRFCCFYQFG